MGIPCITTVQGLAACVQGIEELVRGEMQVRSLQQYAAALNAGRARQDGAPGEEQEVER
jgi:carbamoyl-phosphate synthase large subunit